MVKVQIVVVGKGLNICHEEDLEEPFTDKKVKIGETEYAVKLDGVYTISRFARKSFYRIVFVEGTSDPVGVTKLKEPSATPQMLRIARNSGVAKSAVRELFEGVGFRFGGKKVIFIGLIVGIGVLAYFVMTGQINLGKI